MQKQNPSNESRVKREFPHATCFKRGDNKFIVTYGERAAHGASEREAWRHARRQLDRESLDTSDVDALDVAIEAATA